MGTLKFKEFYFVLAGFFAGIFIAVFLIWIPQSISDAATWVQAITSVVAIIASAWLAGMQWKRQVEADRTSRLEEKADKIGVYIGLAKRILSLVKEAQISFQNGDAGLFSYSEAGFQPGLFEDAITAMKSMSVDGLPDEASIEAWLIILAASRLAVSGAAMVCDLWGDNEELNPHFAGDAVADSVAMLTEQIEILESRRHSYVGHL